MPRHYIPRDEDQYLEGKIIAIDFDGVIHRAKRGYCSGKIYDKPNKRARRSMAYLVARGARVIIFTCRLSVRSPHYEYQRREIIGWLRKNHFYWLHHYHEITALKPRADIFIENKAIQFYNWGDTMNVLREL